MVAVALMATGVTTLVAVLALRRNAVRLHLVDVPNERSSHNQPTPRSGGVAIALGVVAGLGVLLVGGVEFSDATWVVVGCAFFLGAVGLVDDLKSLPVLPRLFAQVLAASFLVAILGGVERVPLPSPLDFALPPLVGWSCSVLWLVGVTNFFNFMDGLDGLAGGQALVTSITAALAGTFLVICNQLVLLCSLFAVALAIFLFFNWSKASVFLGDAGSFLLGFFLAALPWLGDPSDREDLLFIVAASLALFLLDPTWTLVSRWRQGAPLGQAHRAHLYQQLTQLGGSHSRVAASLHLVAIALSAGVLVAMAHPRQLWLVVAAAIFAFGMELRWVSVKRRASARPVQSS